MHRSRGILSLKEVMEKDIGILGELPSLMHLHFQIQQIPKEKIIIYGGTRFLFPVLVNFQFKCERKMSLQLLMFEAGAMPNLQRLELETSVALLKKWDGCTSARMEHLLSLKEICVTMWHGQCTESEIIAAECALRNFAQVHPSRPSITII